MKAQIFNQDVVRHIMDGTQCQDRRPLKKQPDSRHCRIDFEDGILKESSRICGCWNVGRKWKPRHKVGDIIGVRETWKVAIYPYQVPAIHYRAGGEPYLSPKHAQWMKARKGTGWRPSIHMPNWAIRTFLKVTAVRFTQDDGVWYEITEFEITSKPKD